LRSMISTRVGLEHSRGSLTLYKVFMREGKMK
jgi:hypothetical protein